MQSVSNAYRDAMSARVRQPRVKFEVAWDGANWVDESANVQAFRLSRQIEAPGVDLTPQGANDAGSVTLRNRNWRYSAWRTDGDGSIRSHLAGDWGVVGIPARLWVGFVVAGGAVEYCRVFTGCLYNLTESPQAKTVTLSLRDASWRLYQRRMSTVAYTAKRVDDYLATLADAGGWNLATDWAADVSPFTLTAGWLDDDAVLQEMMQAASSVAGRLYCDALGVLRYEEASHWLDHATPVWEFDADDLVDLPPQTNPEPLTSTVVVEYAPRAVGPTSVLYTLTEERVVRPGETQTLDLRLSQAAFEIYSLNSNDYWFDNGAGLPMNSRVTVTMTPYAQRVTLSLTNNHPTQPAVLRYLQLRGRPLVGGPQEEVERVVIASPRVPRVRSVRGNFYVQTRTQASFLAVLLGDRYSKRLTTWVVRNAPGIPPLELGDRVRVRDGRATTSFREGFVIGIESRFQVQASTEPVFAQDIHVLDAEPLFPAATYFRVGSSALGAAVCWY